MNPLERIFVALDTTDIDRATALSRSLFGHVGGIKIGKEFFTANGPAGVHEVVHEGQPLFLDLKFHDIPNTVAGALQAVASINPKILNVHASGGAVMMRAAAKVVAEMENKPLLVAVTVLTSLADDDLVELGINVTAAEYVLTLAKLAQESGLGGVVCSPLEISAIREACGPDFKLIVPGVRPSWALKSDQKRVLTPKQAVSRGADYLVIGRPITGDEDPVAAARKICEEIALA
ncbi:MAG: orotidine-5'-phosphate decarboxylase [Rhodospirillaceae bacterium TMED8]|nr:orotidine-5'-phosphate decarboxylase [Magnetovibrio sp.]OUT49916.1 MAG: orotidine-5'-phosphate decarboxylase [Rhodospirillaceae bacterium TMED8]|tara:strand:- start:1161 stop:1862 length:702 start_codon:yes stop_codon:yes gene_type:complete